MTRAENIRKYYAKKHYNIKEGERMRLRSFEGIESRIWENLSGRINSELKRLDVKRTLSVRELIGCDKRALWEHIQATFTEGMTADNYPNWEVDHQKCVACFDLADVLQQQQCFHFSNLKALWQAHNRSKGSK